MKRPELKTQSHGVRAVIIELLSGSDLPVEISIIEAKQLKLAPQRASRSHHLSNEKIFRMVLDAEATIALILHDSSASTAIRLSPYADVPFV